MYVCAVYILITTTGNRSIIVKVRKNVGNYFEFFFAITNFVSDNNDGDSTVVTLISKDVWISKI